MLIISFLSKHLITVPTIQVDLKRLPTERHITLLDKSGNLEYCQQLYNLSKLALLKKDLAGLENDKWVIDVKRGVSTQQMLDLLDGLQLIGMRHVSLGGLAC